MLLVLWVTWVTVNELTLVFMQCSCSRCFERMIQSNGFYIDIPNQKFY